MIKQRKKNILKAIQLIYKWNKDYGLKANIKIKNTNYLVSTVKLPSYNEYILPYEICIFKNSYFEYGCSVLQNPSIYSEACLNKNEAMYCHWKIVNHFSKYI